MVEPIQASDADRPVESKRRTVSSPFWSVVLPTRPLPAADAMMEVQTADQLGEAVSVLLSSPQQAKEMGKKAQQVVINEKGATERHAWVLLT